METHKPAWWTIVLGVLFMLGAGAGVWYLITTQAAQNLYAWSAVGIVGLTGMWLCVPVRAAALWRELRSALPFLQDPPTDSDR